MPPREPDPLLGVRAAAGQLGVHENTIRNWSKAGIITPASFRGHARYQQFRVSEVERVRANFSRYANSTDSDAARPAIGSLWVREPAELIRVTGVWWNGDEWRVRTERVAEQILLPPILRHDPVLAVLSRFWEECHAIAPRAGVPGYRGMVRRGPAQAEELEGGPE